jgi:hypothetical protein
LGPPPPALSVYRLDALRRLRRRHRAFQQGLYRLANARNKGTCDNKATMRRDHLETAVLDGLQNRLMEPARIKIFCEEYARAMNRLHAEHNAQRAADAEALNKAERDLARLVQALLDGVPALPCGEKWPNSKPGETHCAIASRQAKTPESVSTPIWLNTTARRSPTSAPPWQKTDDKERPPISFANWLTRSN